MVWWCMLLLTMTEPGAMAAAAVLRAEDRRLAPG